MHLFEAALAWVEAGGSPAWRGLAEELAELALSRLIDPASGAVGEHFLADWSAAEAEAPIEPGHQFEWAGLLERWSVMAQSPQALAAAVRLFEAGSAGVDAVRSVAVDEIGPGRSLAATRARLWPQAERLKASCALYRATGDADYRRCAAAAARSLKTYLEVPTPGLWRDKMRADATFEAEPAPASSLYHIAGAIHELDLIS